LDLTTKGSKGDRAGRSPWVSYVPQLIAVDVIRDPRRSPIGREQRFEAAVLISDIAGFTAMSEAFGALGRAGTEEMTQLMNRYFARMTEIVRRNGGDVAKFGGDSMVVLFSSFQDSPVESARHGIHAAEEMQAAMGEFETIDTSAGTFSLSIKIGLGGGRVLCTVVGDPSVRLEYVVAGTALDRAAAAQDAAGPGEIVLQSSLASEFEDLDPLEKQGEFVSISERRKGRLHKDLSPPAPKIIPASTPEADRILASFLHPVIARRVRAGQNDLVNEHRRSTIMFVAFEGVDYDTDRDASLHLQRYFATVLRIVGTYEGHLAQVEMGDKGSKYIVLFGTPIAHEDDAARAVRCSLELASIRDRPMRIGITSGLVFCGHVGSGFRREYAVVGDAANLAARLMAAAGDGEILVASNTRDETHERFQWTPAFELRVKGKRDPVSVVRLSTREPVHESGTQESKHTSKFVGRTEELEVAVEKLGEVAKNQGHLLGVCGEPGIGKSRLSQEIIRLANVRGYDVHTGACQSHDRKTSYLVWRRVWRSILGIGEDAQGDGASHALETRVAELSEDLIPRIPLLGQVLGLRLPENDLTRSMDFESRRDSLKQLLLECLQNHLPNKPTVILLEDCHWIDFLSHDLLTFIGRNIVFLPVFLMFTYRSSGELVMPPSDLQVAHHFTELQLGELEASEAMELVTDRLGRVLGTSDLAERMTRRITSMAEGNPFYIEELANFFLSKSDATDPEALEAVVVPDSLRSLVMTRIDQLAEPEKTTLKVASVIGRSFPASWIWGSYPNAGSSSKVKQYLRKLDRLDLALMRRPEPGLEYAFKHAIVQEVAYESLSLDVRRSLHEGIGRYVEQNHAEELPQFVNTLAHHYGFTENVDKQRLYFRMAADAARSAFANETAIDFYARLAPLVVESERVEILTLMAQLVELIGGWQEAENLYREALVLAERTQDIALEAEVTCRLGNLISYTQGSGSALPLLRQALATFKRIADPKGTGRSLHYLSQVYLDLGDRRHAVECANRQMELATRKGDPVELAAAYENLGLANWDAAPDAALDYFNNELTTADGANYMQGIIHACNNIAGLYLEKGESGTAIAFLQRALEAATRIGYQYLASVIVGNAGIIYRNSGDFSRASACLGTSLRLTLELGDKKGTCNNLGELAVLRSVEGRFDEANILYDKAIELSRVLDIPLYGAEFLYHRAHLQRRQGLFTDAMKSARQSSAAGRRLDQPRHLFRTETLLTLLGIEIGEIDVAEGSQALLRSVNEAPEEDERAAVHYELWRLTGSHESQETAAHLFRELFEQSGNVAYRRFYEELTGGSLPDSAPLPPLPEEVTQHPVDFVRLLDQVDVMLRAAIQERAA
jgi:class 3 adenylate cyclase/tetratricopeptide (TPR) repeat protein